MNEDGEIVEFSEEELSALKTPKQLLNWLLTMDEEFYFLDLSDLLDYYESEEKYELCTVIRDFENDILKHRK